MFMSSTILLMFITLTLAVNQFVFTITLKFFLDPEVHVHGGYHYESRDEAAGT
jgi:hypothetical protein